MLSQAKRDEAAKQSKVVVANDLLNRMGAIPAGGSVPTASRKGVYGSGVVVSRHGDLLTNDHVIQNCVNVRIQPTGAEAKVVAKDAKNDLALLRMEGSWIPAIKLRTGRGHTLGRRFGGGRLSVARFAVFGAYRHHGYRQCPQWLQTTTPPHFKCRPQFNPAQAVARLLTAMGCWSVSCGRDCCPAVQSARRT